MADWQSVPAAVSHVYWSHKKVFQLASDTYRDWVLFAVTGGRFHFGVGNDEGEAGYGDIVFCPPDTAFRREVVEPLSFHFYTFRWEYIGVKGDDEGGRETHPRPLGKVSVVDHNRLSSTYFYLQQQMVSQERRMALVQALFQDLWHLICLEGELTQRTVPAGREDAEMQEAARWLQQHAFGSVLLKELSASKGMSPVQFSRRFYAVFGRTPMEYLTSLRLQKAQTLLAETRLSLDEIAGQCGYENGFYLSRIFSRKLQISPSQYRLRNRL